MAQTSRTFRVFVSSTFSDLKAERNALQEKVFPPLKDLAESHGCRFQAIDLRWGVSEEAALDQQTMKICLGEIERCQKVSPRPNFIILLGDRYGWCPLPFRIPADEFKKIDKHTKDKRDRSLLHTWYRRDDNAVPPEYLLQPRLESLAEYADLEIWDPVETRLRQILLTSLEKEKSSLLPEDLLKYVSSATEQEIYYGALMVEDAKEHVFCFFRQIEELPVNETTRDFHNLQQVEQEWVLDMAARKKLEDLKYRLSQILPGNIEEYQAEWSGDTITTNHIDRLCEDVYKRLEGVIRSEIAKIEQIEPLQREVLAQRTFAEQRARIFIGREDSLGAISDYLDGGGSSPLAFWGQPGTGKSALMAKAVLQLEASRHNCHILYRFIGATPDSSSGRSLLDSLCRQITALYAGEESSIPSEYRDLVQEFPQRLRLAPPEKPLILFLDALNQLSDADNSRSLDWMPLELPPNVFLVVSTTPGRCLEEIKIRLPAENILELCGLSVKDGTLLLERWLQESARTLQPAQKKHVIAQFAREGKPLYLKLAFEEVRHWHSNDGLPKGADDIPGLGDDIRGVLRDLFWRLSQESNHGQLLVERSLGYVAAARSGLSEDELVDILSHDQAVYKWFLKRCRYFPHDLIKMAIRYQEFHHGIQYNRVDEKWVTDWLVRLIKNDDPELDEFLVASASFPDFPRLPTLLWSRLYFDLESYLIERNADGASLLGYYHLQLREAVEADYLGDGNALARHRSLAEYFNRKPTWENEIEKKPALRKTSELTYQQMSGNLWQDLYSTLTDFQFLEARCRASSVYDLETDYRLARSAWRGTQEQKRILVAFEERLRLESHHIHYRPELLFPQMVNHLTWLDKEQNGSIHSICEQALQGHRNWLRMTQDPRPAPPPWLFSFEGHTSLISALAVTLDDRQLVSGSSDGKIKVWNLESGRLLHSLEGHTGSVCALEFTPNGRQIVSGSKDGTIKIWNLETGRLLRTLGRQKEDVDNLAVSRDGRQVIVGYYDGVIMVWDLSTGRLLRSFQGHSDFISALAISPDGRKIISGSGDKLIKLWEMETGRLLRSYEGHTGTVNVLVFPPDSRRIVSGSADNTYKVWDLESGQLLCSRQGETIGLSLTPDARQIITASSDSAIYVRELDTGRVLRHLDPYKKEITALVLTHNGLKVIFGYFDGGMKVRDMESGHILHSLEGHTRDVTSVAMTRDGRKIVSTACSDDRTVRIWDWEQRCLLHSIEAHGGNVSALALTPDSLKVITGSDDKMIKVWDLETGKLLQTFEGLTGKLSKLAITSDSRQIVIECLFEEDNIIQVWDLESGRVLHSLRGDTTGITVLILSPDDRQVICGASSGEILFWDLESGRFLRSFDTHFESIYSLVCTKDGQKVISVSQDMTINVLDLKSGQVLLSQYFEDLPSNVSCLVINPDTLKVITGNGWSIYMWDLESGKLIQCFEGHTRGVNSLAISLDGHLVVSGSGDFTIKVWDLETVREQRALEGHNRYITSLGFTPDEQKVISGSADNTIKVWSMESGRLLHTLEGRTSGTCSLAISSDALRLISATDRSNGTIDVWDLESGKLLHSLEGHTGYVLDVTLTPNCQRIVSASKDKTIKTWDLESGGLLHSLEGHTDAVNSLTITPDGHQIISGSSDKTIKVWNLESGLYLRSLDGHEDAVISLVITPDGRRVVSGSRDMTIKVWDLETGHLLQSLDGHKDGIHYLALLPVSQWIVSGSDDKTIKIWDLEKCKLLSSIEGYMGQKGSAAITPDGRQVVYALKEKTIKGWDLVSGKSINLFINETDIYPLALTKDGKWLVCGDDNGRVWIFEWIREA